MTDAFAKEGYFVRRAMVPVAELAFLREAHGRMFAAREGITTETDDRFELTLERMRDPAAAMPELLDTIFWREGCAEAERLLEGDRMLANLVFISKPAGAPPSPLHQHAAMPRPEVVRDVSIWMPLDDCEGENGCLLLVPGSHARIVPHDRYGRLAGPLPAPERLPLRAGDAVFLHESLVHGAEANATATPRAAVLLYAWTPTALAA